MSPDHRFRVPGEGSEEEELLSSDIVAFNNLLRENGVGNIVARKL